MKAQIEIKRLNRLLGFLNHHAIISMEMVVKGLVERIEIEELTCINNPYGELERMMYSEAREELLEILYEWEAQHDTA